MKALIGSALLLVGLACVPLATPGMGERLSRASPQAGQRWWQAVEGAAQAASVTQTA